MLLSKLPAVLLFCAITLAGDLAWAEARIEMEIATERGLPPSEARRWYDMLTSAGVSNIRIQSGQPGAEPKINSAGSERDPVYKISGQLTSKGRLVLPGKQFGLNDKAAIAKWLDDLKADGPAELTKSKTAFGLTQDQLEETLRDLSQPVKGSTKGQPPADVIRKIASGLQKKLVIDPSVRAQLLEEDPVRDELDGISSGTAMAAILRPAGAVLQPRRAPGEPIQYFVTNSRPGMESWPVGWPAEKSDRELLPILFDFLNVEIDGISASQALEAIQGRLKAPLLFDYNSLAEQGIEFDKVEVKVPGNRSYYGRILDRVLYQAQAKKEVRVDEAGKPLLWVTTVKPK